MRLAYKWQATLIAALGLFMAILDNTIVSVTLPQMLTAFHFPPTERGQATALIGVSLLLAPAFGPTVGGYLSTAFAWRAIFIINLPIGIVAFLLASIILHGQSQERDASDGERPEKKSFDVLGLLLSMVGFTALVYGITEAGSHGWGDAAVVPYLIGGDIALVAFVIVELLVSDPAIETTKRAHERGKIVEAERVPVMSK